MVLTPSTMRPLGMLAPAFELPDVVSGELVSLDSYGDGDALLVIFLCAHCPYVKHIREELARFGHDYRKKGLGIVAISANDPATHPGDAPAQLAEDARTAGYTFPVLFDATQSVAKAYGAACTPDFFLFDAQRRLVYRGQFDASRPNNGLPVTGADLRSAVDAVLGGKAITREQKPSVGCNIKWRAGNEPPCASGAPGASGVAPR